MKETVVKKSEEKTIETVDQLTLIQNLPWFLAEQQTRQLPEFILMFTGNTVSISADFAKQNTIQATTILKLNIDDQIIFAKAKINNNISTNIMLVNLFELPLSKNNFSLATKNISKATNDEIDDFQQREFNRKQAAKQEKADVLERLKKQDQTVPITFYDDIGVGQNTCNTENKHKGESNV